MANTNPPKKNQAWVMWLQMEDIATPGRMKNSPTLAAGDFTLIIDGVASTLGAAGSDSLATLPTVTPAASAWVKISLSASEMNGDVIGVRCADQTSPPQWPDVAIVIQTTA